ncbi:hypothetical protein GCM10007242_44710 [Pigmentiphaga litoralis]|uniref:phage tail assembly chaperone n=1 Tax=Pigmentiphaga litoralis TaxID=516702 RepID=UPI0016770BB0|nr:phage tail assembly chaperone [Pigmentiphaga litoralis]GGX32814.1 hypothetical protein GCM10007242_44710 [Pigmentiphaga litoralis]
MARKFALTASPTFKLKVDIPIPGAKPEPVEFIFKHRTRDDFLEFLSMLAGRGDVEVILDIASGWDLEDAFTADNVARLTQQYLGAANAVISAYTTELPGLRLGN